MDSNTESLFKRTANELGLQPKLLYTMKEVSRVTGVAYSTLLDECTAGRLKYHLPEGRKQGRLFRPEWVDEWIEKGASSHGQAA